MKMPSYKNFSTAFVTVSFALTSIFAPHQVYGSTTGARIHAAVLFNVLKADSWNVRDSFSTGLLQRGQSILIRTTLHAGNTYKIAAAGCEDSYDVDIAVYDENGNFVDGDDDTDRLAVADIAPAWSGTFILKVTMYNSTPNGAHYVVQYAWTK